MTITITHHDAVAVVTIDRADKANAVDSDMHRRLAHLWRELEDAAEVGAVVLTGRGTVFCAGGDSDKWDSMVEDRRYRRRRLIEAREIIRNMLLCELPVVAAVNGPAVGLGCSLVAACDLVYMAEGAYLRDPHVMAGIVAGDGGAALLPELLPVPVARAMLYEGMRLDAATAERVMFAREVLPADALVARAVEVAANLAAQPWEALRDTKRSVNMGLLQRIGPVLEMGAGLESTSFDTPELRDRVAGDR